MGRFVLRAALAFTAVIALLVTIAFVRVGSINVGRLATQDIGRSALMKQREREARAAGRAYHESRRVVRLDAMSRQLRQAVLVAEDDKFFSHDGFDWAGIQYAARRNLKARKAVRGGSTITQQLAKNLWLGTARTPWRKFEEMILAVRLERALTKRRILELYLNTIEWGDGVYGIDAAARHWFGVGAGSLDAQQAIRLAAVIINPRRFSPAEPNKRIQGRVKLIAGRMKRRGAISDAEYRHVLGLPPEAPAPAVDSSLFTPADVAPGAPVDTVSDSTAPAPADPAPPEPEAAPEPAPDSTGAPR